MKVTAAGVILYRVFQGHPKILGLVALPDVQKRNNGTYDIPKGHIDPGEKPFDAAIRECYEESGLTPTRFKSGPFIDGPLTVWLAETSGNPSIGLNPVSGLPEHLGYTWLDPDSILQDCLDYLKPVLKWAKSELCKRH